MKKLLLGFIAFALHLHATAQLDEGAYYFVGESHYVEMSIEDGGWSIASVTVIDMESGTRETGSGSWHDINLEGADENYDGPDGFYEFETEYCFYDFNAPLEYGEMVEFNRSECELSGTLFLILSTEIEAGMILDELLNGSAEEWSDESYDEYGEYDEGDYSDYSEGEFEDEESEEFDYAWANQGYDEIEAKLLPWTTETGTALQEAILKFQPTLADCKAVFSDEDYIAVYASVTAAFAEMLNGINENPEESMGYNYIRVQPIVFDQPGIMLYPGNGPFALRSAQAEYYEFTFLDSETSEYGRSMTLIVKVGDRYVIFPQD